MWGERMPLGAEDRLLGGNMHGQATGTARKRSHEERMLVRDVNWHVTCRLCNGYLIDATTIQECLHSFCRCCIVRFLKANHFCPVCGVRLHKSNPPLNIRPDRILQKLVYKLVPGLFKDEMRRRHEVYFPPKGTPPTDLTTSIIKPRNDYSHIIMEDEKISICLRCQNDTDSKAEKNDSRYFLCPAMMTAMHMKKLIRCKFDLSPKFQIELSCPGVSSLTDDLSLIDVAYIQQWPRIQPMSLDYTIFKELSEDDLVKKKPNVYVISDNDEEEITVSPVEPRVEFTEEVSSLLPLPPPPPPPPPDLITSCAVSSTDEPCPQIVDESSDTSGPADENGNVCPSVDVKKLETFDDSTTKVSPPLPKSSQTFITASSQSHVAQKPIFIMSSANVSPVISSTNTTVIDVKPESPFVKRYFTSSNSKSSKNGAPSFPTRPGGSFPGMPTFSSKNSRKLSMKSKPHPGNLASGGLRTILSNGIVRNLPDGIAPAANNIIMKAIPVVPFVKNGNALPSSISFHLVPCTTALTSTGHVTFLDSSVSKFSLGGIPVLGTTQSILLKPVVSTHSSTKTTEIKPKTTSVSIPTSTLVSKTSQMNFTTASVASATKLSQSSTSLPVQSSIKVSNPMSVCINIQQTENPAPQFGTAKELDSSSSPPTINSPQSTQANPHVSTNQLSSIRFEPKPGNHPIPCAQVPRLLTSLGNSATQHRRSVPVSIEHILPTLLPTLKSETTCITPLLKPKIQEEPMTKLESVRPDDSKTPPKRPNNFDLGDTDSTPIKKLKLMCNGIEKVDPQQRKDQENFLRTFATNSPVMPPPSPTKAMLSPGTPDGQQCRYMHRKHHIMKSLSISSSISSPEPAESNSRTVNEIP